MDRQVRYSKQRPREVEQDRPRGGCIPQRHPARDGQVAIEPGVKQEAAVGLDGELTVAVRRDVGPRLHSQVRRVGVRADDPEAPADGGLGPDLEGDQAPATADREAAISGGEVPDLVLCARPEAASFEPARRLGDGVVGRGRGVDEREQVANEVRHSREGSDARGPRQLGRRAAVARRVFPYRQRRPRQPSGTGRPAGVHWPGEGSSR